MMRFFLPFALLFAFNLAQSEEVKNSIPPSPGKAEASDKKNNPAAAKQEITVNLPSGLNVNLGGKLDIKSQSEQTRAYEESSKWSDPVTWFTFFLVIANILLWLEAKTNSGIAKVAANAAKESADAAVNASKPYIFPRAIDLDNLHPDGKINDGDHYDPTVSFIFENYGETPGIIREVRADLFLSEVKGKIPPVPKIKNLTQRRHDTVIIVPGHTYGEAAQQAARSVVKCGFRTLTAQELRELTAVAASRKNFRRFYLMGQIVYDDFFGIQSTQRFCFKLRAHGFQAIRGGSAYNTIKREKIPQDDLEEASP